MVSAKIKFAIKAPANNVGVASLVLQIIAQRKADALLAAPLAIVMVVGLTLPLTRSAKHLRQRRRS